MSYSVMRYHNQSSFIIGGSKVHEETSKKEAQRRIKTEEFNSKLPTFDPKLGNRSQIVFGDEKPNFSKKQKTEISSPSRVPPGGKSQIIFGWVDLRLIYYCWYFIKDSNDVYYD